MSRTLSLQLPEKLQCLFEPKRYKILYGGRGGAKSWSAAAVAIVKSLEKPIRIGCFREIQNSIKESIHKLLSDQIQRLGLSSEFTITEHSIKSRIGSEFIFEGLYRNVNRIKSLEGIDLAIVEEAEKVSDPSWDTLIPTIRKDNSEIWVIFNTQFEDDATYRRFVANPPDNSIVQQINYYDNPWFPDVLKAEMEQDKLRDFQKYLHIWMGKPLGSGRKVWHGFQKSVHIKQFPMDLIAKRGNCYMAMDPHLKYYPFCLWIAVIPKNERMNWPEDFYHHVYAEWPTFEMLGDFYHNKRTELFYKGTLNDLAKEIYAKDGIEFGIKIRNRFIDPRYAKGTGSESWSSDTTGVVDLFSKPENGGLLFNLPDIKQLDAQRHVIHDDMLWNPLLGSSVYNEPGFSVSPLCKNLIASLSNHRLEDDSEKESEKYKDASDTLRIGFAGFQKLGYIDDNAYVPTGGQSQYTRRLEF
jgi:terminase large subunit-like protein